MQLLSAPSSRLLSAPTAQAAPAPPHLPLAAPVRAHTARRQLRRQQLRRDVSLRVSELEEVAAPQGNGNGKVQLAYHGQGPARTGLAERMTKETQVSVSINLDGTGKCVAETPVGFLNHMLDQIASHGMFDLTVKANGDTWIDDHHTVEDIALALGTSFSQALGDRKGIHRFGEFTAPLDEALCQVVLDLSGRPHCSCGLTIPAQRIGNFDTELVEHFFSSFSNTSGTTLHIRQLAGKNSHHIVECTFKAFARALRVATEYDPRRQGMIASSKGVLTQQ